MRNSINNEICLTGLDGSNPLGFLAAIGTFLVMHGENPGVKIGWRREQGKGWRPVLSGCSLERDAFAQSILSILKEPSEDFFEIDDRLPFEAEKFAQLFSDAHANVSADDRRTADFLVGIGYPMVKDAKKDKAEAVFQETKFCIKRNMPKGGLPKYVRDGRKQLNLDRVRIALFELWDYQDKEPGLRLDPMEDHRHAYAKRDPSGAGTTDRPVTMLAANMLAVEAFQVLPTFLLKKEAQTTGMHAGERGTFNFVWPLWSPMIGKDTLRSLLSFPYPKKLKQKRRYLNMMGIEEIYCSRRIVQVKGQSYRNLTPARPL